MTAKEFETLIHIHGNDIYRFCRYITLNKENADDLYQDTMLTAFKKAETIKLNNNPKSYLLSVAIKLSHNFFRKEKRRNEHSSFQSEKPFDEIADSADTQASLEDNVLKNALRLAVASLDEKHRVPIVLYYFDEHNLEFISNVMKIPEGTVKSRLHKARELIAQKLKKEGFDND